MTNKRCKKSNSYLVHYRSYQGVTKGKQVASFTKWGLRDNVVLRLMECLTPTVSCHLFMANYFTSFRIFVSLPTLELTICEQVVSSTKTGYANTPPSGINSCNKKERANLKSAAHIKKKRCVTCRLGYNDSWAPYIAFSEICQPNRNLFGTGTKLKESIRRLTTKLIPMLQPEHGFCQKNGSDHSQLQEWYPNKKIVVVPVCLNGRCCSSG